MLVRLVAVLFCFLQHFIVKHSEGFCSCSRAVQALWASCFFPDLCRSQELTCANFIFRHLSTKAGADLLSFESGVLCGMRTPHLFLITSPRGTIPFAGFFAKSCPDKPVPQIFVDSKNSGCWGVFFWAKSDAVVMYTWTFKGMPIKP